MTSILNLVRWQSPPVVAVVGVIGLALLAGCGGNDLATVTGVVKLDGQALESGSVTFSPEESGPLAYADVATDGSYKLKSGASDEIKPGKYIATVSRRRGRPGPNMTISQIEALEMVPVRYTTKAASTLRQDVVPGANQIDLELTSAP